MKADYKNWVPKYSIKAFRLVGYLCAIIFVCLAIYIFNRKANGQEYLVWLSVVDVILFLASVILLYFVQRFKLMHKMFSFEDVKSVSWSVINFTANSLNLKDGDKVLDVGCGSGALSIAVAKRNPNCEVVGIDRWSGSYKIFTKELCESNAKAEGVTNVTFKPGNAVKLDIPDESFDAVTSNYVYHNIPGNRQKYLLETFRVLKKGGVFAIHDIFIKVKYGDIEKFKQKLLDMGFEKVEFVDTTAGKAITRENAKKTMLTGSKLLVGIK